MRTRTLIQIILTLTLIVAVFAGVANAQSRDGNHGNQGPALQNLRDFAPARQPGGVQYAVDGGRLMVDEGQGWHPVTLPEGVIANAVALDPQDEQMVYVGAANELAVYVSRDGGQDWLRVPLATDTTGMVTDLAVDGVNRLVYAATDTAGLFRLRDVGSSMIASGHLILDEPVLQVVADSRGSGVAYIRTPWHVFRAEEFGLSWLEVAGIPGPATALALAEGDIPTVYVGTANDGVWASQDGTHWQAVNTGLMPGAGARVRVDALAVDPAMPQVLYASTSLLFGSTQVRTAHVGVALSTDAGLSWQELAPVQEAAVVELYPVTGQPGAVYAVTEFSRTPLALGDAPALVAAATPDSAGWTTLLAWLLAVLAGLTLLVLFALDLRDRQRPLGSGRPQHRSA